MAPISPPATLTGHHYIKRSTIFSCPEFHPPKQYSNSAHRSKAESISGTSTTTTSHFTNTSIHSRPSSSHPSHPSHPANLISLGYVDSPAHPTVKLSQLAMIDLPPPIVTPQTGSQLTPPPSTQTTHRQEILPPSPQPALHLPPPIIYLEQAMKAELVDRFGKALKFEDLIDRDFTTVVILIRHFRSGYSQKYIRRLSKIANGRMSLKSSKDDDQSIRGSASTVSVGTAVQSNKCDEAEQSQQNWISANGIKVVVIGNGNYELIDSYRAILNCPFPIYTDLSKDQRVYQLLGMKKIKDVKLHQSAEKHYLDYQQQWLANYRVQSLPQDTNGQSRTSPSAMKNHSEPVIHNQESKLAFLSKVLYNAWRMPWKWSGDPQQLGGELVFEPIREDKRIKRKPIKYKVADDLLEKSTSTRSTSSSTSTSANSYPDQDHPVSGIANHPFRRPSCSIKNNNSSILSRSKNPRSVRDTVKEVQVQCKFIHGMTNYQDHFPIDELMMMSGIRLTSLIQSF